ncbi:hypothetical protein EVAR_91728_1 [Eumeta japonica]|uniref:Uncharacterized protein n=1 Tax=Eumeta variegata TaxID=151549 RepID=A0A4C1T441_EUMVA|nr:hypothetical protein EVAR_91728_1 [Eumeta japonica]
MKRRRGLLFQYRLRKRSRCRCRHRHPQSIRIEDIRSPSCDVTNKITLVCFVPTIRIKTTALPETESAQNSPVSALKCMATPPKLKCMRNGCTTHKMQSGASDTVASRHLVEARLNKV